MNDVKGLSLYQIKARRREITADVAYLNHLSAITLAIIGKKLVDRTIVRLKEEIRSLYSK